MYKYKRNEERANKISLSILFTLIIFSVLLLSIGFTVIAGALMSKLGIMTTSEESPMQTVFFLAIFSLVVGFGLAYLSSRIQLKPVTKMVTQMYRLASGDFKARLEFGKPIGSHPVFKQIAESFNKMASELENTEMLRTDFINNFSHEFKTPIVSIAGFAKLLQRGNLTEKEKSEYLAIIEQEALRLSYMANNVFNLTKVESRTILSEVNEYNLSEQLRACLLILENKWDKKNLGLNMNFDEHTITANEELLQQVWINLLDNAIKFSDENGKIDIEIEERKKSISVTITNYGYEIPEEKLDKIFRKFYQADESHATEGNGVGLAIVKMIVDLHKGEIIVNSNEEATSFTIILPKRL